MSLRSITRAKIRRSVPLALAGAVWLAAALPGHASDSVLKPTGSGPVPPSACKTPATVISASGFTLVCGKRIPAGIFLGAYLTTSSDDAIDGCAKRCLTSSSCRAFSLEDRDPPAARMCSLFGSVESISDAPASAWVVGMRVDASLTGGKSAGADWDFNYPHGTKFNKPVIVFQPADPGSSTVDAKGTISKSVGGMFTGWGKFASQFNKSVTGFWADNASGPGDKPEVSLTPDMKALQPVYFATDRKRIATAALATSLSDEPVMEMTYGRAIVSIPEKHKIGTVERPKFRFIRLGFEPETDREHFRIKVMDWLERDAFVGELKGAADSLLLFIHGYNVPFADALFKAAQIAYDANFAGSVLVFAWPSAGNPLKYDKDRESADFAAPHLVQTLRLISEEIGKKNVYVVAHSMGNQILVNALKEAALSKIDLSILELVMAAPDIDRKVFESKADQVRAIAKNITLYASAADKALRASGEKSFGTRLGFVGQEGPNIFPGIEVIDVTAVGDDMLGLNHSVATASRAVLDDLGRLIRSITHLPPDLRTPTLKFMPNKTHVRYWLYPP